MTYVVKEECIKCKLMDCIKVCPTDCFREGENMLVIFPEDCIDCGLCVAECPVDAIAGPVDEACLLYTSPSPRDATLSRMPSSA